jgi:hypothetical protein
MAHFAEIDENNIVQRVLVVDNSLEDNGIEFLTTELNLGGTWIQTSYDGKIRKQFAGIGFTYNKQADVFIAPQPYPSWTLDENYDWQAPIPKPNGDYQWNEELGEWVNGETL